MSWQQNFLLKSGLYACVLFASAALASQLLADNHQADDLKSRLKAQKSGTEFHATGRPRQAILVVMVDVTKEEAVVRNTGAKVIHGQWKTNSARADLLIEAFSGNTLKASYQTTDPRLAKGEDRRRIVADTAMMYVYVPLFSGIDRVRISAVPGRESAVSGGGSFDPRPIMDQVCNQLAVEGRDDSFLECIDIGAIVYP